MNMNENRMTTSAEARKKLTELATVADTICETVKTAKKHKRSLSGTGFYAEKFRAHVLQLNRLGADLLRIVEHIGIQGDVVDQFRTAIRLIENPETSISSRAEQAWKLRSISQLVPPHN